MPLVECQDLTHVVTFGEHDDRRVGEADREVRVPLHHLPSVSDIDGGHRHECVGPALDLFKQAYSRGWSDSRSEQIVELGQHEWRQQERWRGGGEAGGGGAVPLLTCVQRGEQTAGVEQDHSPKPSASS